MISHAGFNLGQLVKYVSLAGSRVHRTRGSGDVRDRVHFAKIQHLHRASPAQAIHPLPQQHFALLADDGGTCRLARRVEGLQLAGNGELGRVLAVVEADFVLGGLHDGREALLKVGLEPQRVSHVAAQLLARHGRLVERDLHLERVLVAAFDRRHRGVDGGRGRFGRRVAVDLRQHQPPVDETLHDGGDGIDGDVLRNQREPHSRPHVRERDDLRVDDRQDPVDDLGAHGGGHAERCTERR